MPRSKLERWLSFGLRLIVAGAFAAASLLKMRDPSGFAEQVGNYQLLPELSNFIAILLPSLELTCAMALLLGPKYWRAAGAFVLLGMLVVFTSAIGRAWAMGINLECGCFGAGSTSIGPWPILRNLALSGALALGLWLDWRAGTSDARRAIDPPVQGL